MLMTCDVETIARNRRVTRNALIDALHLYDADVECRVRDLLGVGLDYLFLCGVRGKEPLLGVAQLDAMAATVTGVNEINWAREPQSECERAVRAAIIARIESEYTGYPETVHGNLCGLLDTTFRSPLGCWRRE
jgi:hypothetical protein